MFKNNVATVDVAELLEALKQRPEIWSFLFRTTRVSKIANSGNFAGLLLRPRGAW